MPTKAIIECTHCGTVAICTMLWPDEVMNLDIHCPICDRSETYLARSADLVPDKFEHYIVKPLEKKTYGKTNKNG